MTEAQFWQLIDTLRDEAPPNPAQRLAELLGGDVQQLVAFHRWWTLKADAAYDWPLWDAAYVLLGGCSDDGFWDFRQALVGRGQAAYEAITRDPDAIVDWFEDEDDFYDQTQALGELNHGVQRVWRGLTGAADHAGIEHPDLTLRTTPTGTPRPDDADEEADLRASVPRAFARYAEDGDAED